MYTNILFYNAADNTYGLRARVKSIFRIFFNIIQIFGKKTTK